MKSYLSMRTIDLLEDYEKYLLADELNIIDNESFSGAHEVILLKDIASKLEELRAVKHATGDLDDEE